MPKSKPFHEFLFDSTIVNEIEPIDWWKSQTTRNCVESVLRMIQQLLIRWPANLEFLETWKNQGMS